MAESDRMQADLLHHQQRFGEEWYRTDSRENGSFARVGSADKQQ